MRSISAARSNSRSTCTNVASGGVPSTTATTACSRYTMPQNGEECAPFSTMPDAPRRRFESGSCATSQPRVCSTNEHTSCCTTARRAIQRAAPSGSPQLLLAPGLGTWWAARADNKEQHRQQVAHSHRRPLLLASLSLATSWNRRALVLLGIEADIRSLPHVHTHTRTHTP